MQWHPPLSPWVMVVVVGVAMAFLGLSYVLPRRQMTASPRALLTTLALRGLALLLMMFFLYQPRRLPGPQTVTTRRTLAVLIDTSASMSQRDAAGDGEPTRLDLAVTHVVDSNLIADVGTVAGVSLYQFHARLEPVKVEALRDLTASGAQTDLATAVEQVRQRHRGDDLAGVVIVSDGRSTQARAPLQVATESRAPVYVLPVGRAYTEQAPETASPRKDLAVVSVAAPPRVILGNPVQVAVTLEARGFGAYDATVELLEAERPLSSSSAIFSADRSRRQVMFTVTPSAVGIHEYHVTAPVDPEETDQTNNIKSFTVDVVDPVNRLVYVDALRNERRFLKRVIDANRHVKYVAIVQQNEKRLMMQGNDAALKAEAAELNFADIAGLKVLVLGDITAAALGDERIAPLVDWVDRGGCLLLLGGPRSLGADGFTSTPLAGVLPVTLADPPTYSEKPIAVALTTDGAAHPAFQRVADTWKPPTPLLSSIGASSIKPAAVVLVAQQQPPHAPIVAAQRYGHGKVVVVLTDSTWRWQLAAGAGRGPSAHDVFWRQIIDWLLPELKQEQQSASTVQLITDRLTYEMNEPVALIAQVRGSDGQPIADATVEFAIASPDDRTIRREGHYDAQARAFNATFPADLAGRYRVQAIAKRHGAILGSDDAQIEVTQPAIEFINPQPDHEALQRIADASGGQVLTADDLRQLRTIINLEPHQVRVQPNAVEDAEPIWNAWFLMAAFILLLSGEWFIRRRQQWV